MSSEWKRVRLGDIITLKGGFAYKGEFLGSGGAKLLGMGVVSHSERFLKNGMRSYSGGFPESFRAEPGDIVIATRQQSDNLPILGCPALLPPDSRDKNFIVGTNLYKVTNTSAVDNRFLYWLLRGSEYRNRILECSKGTTVRMITKDAIEDFTFLCPPSPIRQEITVFLDALDERITLLSETNATLEAIAQALFKSWFVDFDPVRAKMEGRAPDGMDEATAALFPDSFEETELGVVPRGWGIARLDSFLELAYGKALKAETRTPGGVPVYGSGGITGWHDTALVDTPSVIVGRKGTVGSIYWESRPFFPIDTVFYVKTKRPLTYCHQLLKTLGLHDMNTDGAVPGLNRENVYRLLVPDAPPAVLAAFDMTAHALRQRIDHFEAQAQTLSTLRDTLLPRLISGQLRLPETFDNQCLTTT